MDSTLRIVLVEDHDDLREATVVALGAMGHQVRGVDCAESLSDELGGHSVDIFVLDLNLPGEDGLSLANRLRNAEPNVGIIMLTARDRPSDKMLGYDSGADIYLTKPTSPDELGSAINALARRLHPQRAGKDDFVLNPATLQIQGKQGVVDISDHECALLMAFAQAHDRRLETWQMMEIVGKAAEEPSKGTLEVQIVRLRKKLEQAGATGPTIKALRGTGYQLCVTLVVRRI